MGRTPKSSNGKRRVNFYARYLIYAAFFSLIVWFMNIDTDLEVQEPYSGEVAFSDWRTHPAGRLCNKRNGRGVVQSSSDKVFS